MNNKAAVSTWEATANEFTEFIIMNRRQPAGNIEAEKPLYDWGLRQVTRLNRGMLTDLQEEAMNAILDLFEKIASRYPTRTPSLDAAEQFHAAHGRLPLATGPAEEAEAAKTLKGYIRACRYRDGFRADVIERLLALPGAIPSDERAAFERSLHHLRTYRLPLAAPAGNINFKSVPLNPAARSKRIPKTTPVRANQEYRYADKWKAVFAEFSQWVADHGALPRRRAEDPQEKRLANWLNVQRRNHRAGEIPAALEALLSSVAGALEPAQFKTASQWYANIDRFLAENSRLPSPRAASGTEERSMAEYISGRLRPALRSGTVQEPDSEALARIIKALPAKRG